MNLMLSLPVLFFSIVFHEYAHGWMAYRCGDDTAYRSNRMTMNPLPHIDPFGSIILPLMLTLMRVPILLAWAKPVPVNPFNFHNRKRGTVLVSLAGPAANMLLAVGASLLLLVIKRAGLLLPESFGMFVWIILHTFVILNVYLAVFNMVPIPPIDGSKLLLAMLPEELATKIESYSGYGFFLIFFLLSTGMFQTILGGTAGTIIGLLLKGI